MNSLLDLINLLEPEPYYFVGSCWVGEKASGSFPIECDCEFTHDTVSVCGDGVIKLRASGQQHPFQVRLRLATPVLHATSVEVTTPPLGEMKGKLFFVDSAGSFIGRSNSAALSAQLSFSERRVMSLVGALEIGQRYFGYSLRGAITSNRATLSNVVGIRAPKRA